MIQQHFIHELNRHELRVQGYQSVEMKDAVLALWGLIGSEEDR